MTSHAETVDSAISTLKMWVGRRAVEARFKGRGMRRRRDIEESKSDADAEAPIRCVSLRDDRRPGSGLLVG
jgi:hypothetical protein